MSQSSLCGGPLMSLTLVNKIIYIKIHCNRTLHTRHATMMRGFCCWFFISLMSASIIRESLLSSETTTPDSEPSVQISIAYSYSRARITQPFACMCPWPRKTPPWSEHFAGCEVKSRDPLIGSCLCRLMDRVPKQTHAGLCSGKHGYSFSYFLVLYNWDIVFKFYPSVANI